MTTSHLQLAALKQATPLVERLDAIDRRLAALTTEKLAADNALLPKGEVTARLLEWLATVRTQFEQSGGTFLGDDVAIDLVSRFSQDAPQAPIVGKADHVFQLLVWLLWPAIEASAPAAVQRTAYTEGPRLKVRTATRARLTEERATLVAEREGLVEQAVSMTGGALKIEHLPETFQQRERDRRNEELLQARQAHEAANSHRRVQPHPQGWVTES